MTAQGWLQIAIYMAALTALTPLLGAHMARVYTGRRTFLSPVLAPVERLAYRAIRADPAVEQDWGEYARTAVVFSALFWLALYLILRTQGIQPFNPQGLGSGPWDLSFNTASSFVTNTNWQFYGGEATLSYFSQMAGLAVQNFVSAAVGMAVLAAVIRGFASRGGAQLGNFWRDLIRTLLYILLPLSLRRGAVPRLPGGDSNPCRRHHLHHPRRGPSRRWRSAPSPRRSRSSSSAPTAAASSTSTARCPSRTRPGSRASSRRSSSC